MNNSIITQNLVDFYIDFLDLENNLYPTESLCHSFIHIPWPNLIINNYIELNNDILFNKPSETVYISESKLLNNNIKLVLKNNDFIPVTRWWGMEWDNIFKNDDFDKAIQVEKIDSYEKIDTWINIITQSPLVSIKPEDDIKQLPFIKTFKKPCFQYYLIYFNSKPVGTFLFYSKENITGIYMVSVLPEYRRKGIMQTSINNILAQINPQKVILHSTLMARNAYHKMGFNELLTYDIYIKK